MKLPRQEINFTLLNTIRIKETIGKRNGRFSPRITTFLPGGCLFIVIPKTNTISL